MGDAWFIGGGVLTVLVASFEAGRIPQERQALAGFPEVKRLVRLGGLHARA